MTSRQEIIKNLRDIANYYTGLCGVIRIIFYKKYTSNLIRIMQQLNRLDDENLRRVCLNLEIYIGMIPSNFKERIISYFNIQKFLKNYKQHDY